MNKIWWSIFYNPLTQQWNKMALHYWYKDQIAKGATPIPGQVGLTKVDEYGRNWISTQPFQWAKVPAAPAVVSTQPVTAIPVKTDKRDRRD